MTVDGEITTPWTPANDVERELHDAVAGGELADVVQVLALAPLFLPGFPSTGDSDAAPRQRLLTRERDGVPYVLVFTSPEALYRIVRTDGWRQTTLQEVAGGIPQGWGLAVNPATPVVVLIPPEDLAGLVPTEAGMAGFEPANEVERLIRDALVAPDPDVLMDVLVTARVLASTQAVLMGGLPTVPVFTSPERYADCFGGRDTAGAGRSSDEGARPDPAKADMDVPTVTIDLVAALRQWPGSDHRLAVNPGSPIAITLRGDRIPDLLGHAVELTRRLDRRPTPGGAAVVVVPTHREESDDDPPMPVPPGDIADLLRGPG
jgi:SseB protein N-terminal domain